MSRGIGSYISKQDKERIRSYKFCFYCLRHCDNVAIDHIHPIAKGGNSETKNLTGACIRCNSMKSDLSITDFLFRVIDRRQAVMGKSYTYIMYIRRHRKKGTRDDLIAEYISKLHKAREVHSDYTNIVHSITNHLFYCIPHPLVIWKIRYNYDNIDARTY